MTRPACPYCGGPGEPFLEAPDFNRRVGDEVFTYYRCGSCGLIFLAPIPEDLGRYYPGDYHGLTGDRTELASAAEAERYKIDLVRRFVPSGTLTEIGPGRGAFALLAKDAGFDVRVIEMSADSCDYIARTVGVETICTDDEVAALDSGDATDVIALWHVAEHLGDPFELVRVAARKLSPGGVLVIAAPNPFARQFRILGRRWAHLDAPRHVYLIPPDVLAGAAEAAGLTLELETTTDPGSLGWNDFGWRFSFANRFRRPHVRGVAARIGGLVGKLMRPIESREGEGAAYTMVFRKAEA